MATYKISNRTSGVEIGIFEGATREEALDAMARDQGYVDFAAQCEAIESDGSDIRCEEV